MRKTTIKSKRILAMIAGVGLAATLSAVLLVGTTFSSFSFVAPFEVEANNGQLVATIKRGVDDDEKALTDAMAALSPAKKTIADITGASASYTTVSYTDDGITVTDGTTAFYTDSTHFTNFAPGQTRLEAFEVTNSGTVPINLNMSMLYSYDAANNANTTETWDEQDPAESLNSQVWYRVSVYDSTTSTLGSPGTWAAAANADTMDNFTSATVINSDDPMVTLNPGDVVEVFHFVEFIDGGAPDDNESGDNTLMNSVYGWTLTFNMTQP